MQSHALLDSEDCLIILNYATRLMAVDLGREVLLERAAEAISDFSANKNVALFVWDGNKHRIQLEGIFKDRRFQSLREEVPLEGTRLEEIIVNREFTVFPNRKGFDTPMPAEKGQEEEGWCLCLPLIGTAAKMIGIIAIMAPGGRPRPTKELQLLHILTTVIAISLENSELFQMATRDVLTGLYIRNIFEIRLREELERVRRQGGIFSILMTDIDHFKTINDTYGHESGNHALKEIAGIFRKCVRGDLDLVCRYGGDEFITLMANTGAREAMKIAERIHERCRAGNLAISGAASAISLSSGLLTVGGGRERKKRRPGEEEKGIDRQGGPAPLSGERPGREQYLRRQLLKMASGRQLAYVTDAPCPGTGRRPPPRRQLLIREAMSRSMWSRVLHSRMTEQ